MSPEILKAEIGECLIRAKSKETIDTLDYLMEFVENHLNNGWVSVKEQQPNENEEVIINLNGKPQIAVYGGKARDTDEYMFYSSFKLISDHSCVYASSWTCNVGMWYPLTALPDNWIELEQEQPAENVEVIIRFCGEPRIAISAGEVVSGDEQFFDFGFEYDPDFCSSHDKFMSSYSHEITQWQPLPQPSQDNSNETSKN